MGGRVVAYGDREIYGSSYERLKGRWELEAGRGMKIEEWGQGSWGRV